MKLIKKKNSHKIFVFKSKNYTGKIIRMYYASITIERKGVL